MIMEQAFQRVENNNILIALPLGVVHVLMDITDSSLAHDDPHDGAPAPRVYSEDPLDRWEMEIAEEKASETAKDIRVTQSMMMRELFSELAVNDGDLVVDENTALTLLMWLNRAYINARKHDGALNMVTIGETQDNETDPTEWNIASQVLVALVSELTDAVT